MPLHSYRLIENNGQPKGWDDLHTPSHGWGEMSFVHTIHSPYYYYDSI
jgi:hypothetical protein